MYSHGKVRNKMAGGPVDFYIKRRKWKKFKKNTHWIPDVENYKPTPVKEQGLDLLDVVIIGTAIHHHNKKG